ncbi:MAG: hypothetical protein JHD35_24540 [Sphingopyxis sp.]|nr:hypothetical protein [Sphingopyxis sp.]
MGMMAVDVGPALFNTPLEAGLRAVIILEAFEPAQFDIATISLLDYFLVHTADARGPESIHPDISARGGEYFVRRHLIEQGVALMMRSSLIEQIPTASGILFHTHETAAAMLDLLSTDYNRKLVAAANWLATQARDRGEATFLRDLRSKIDLWSQEMIGGSTR